jgi:hypothetical protein
LINLVRKMEAAGSLSPVIIADTGRRPANYSDNHS